MRLALLPAALLLLAAAAAAEPLALSYGPRPAYLISRLPGGALRDRLQSCAAQTLTHAESIALFQSLGAKFMPELKAPAVPMPFNGFTQQDFAQKLIDDYKAAGIAPADVRVQSFSLDDILYWIEHEPAFGRQAVLLDGSYRQEGFDHSDPATFPHDFAALKAQGVNYLAPPLWMLVTVRDGRIVPSAYAIAAKAAGLQLITWTLERSGPLQGGEWYFQSLDALPRDDGLSYQLLHVLAQDVGGAGVFSDWPATVTHYANCMGL